MRKGVMRFVVSGRQMRRESLFHQSVVSFFRNKLELKVLSEKKFGCPVFNSTLTFSEYHLSLSQKRLLLSTGKSQLLGSNLSNSKMLFGVSSVVYPIPPSRTGRYVPFLFIGGRDPFLEFTLVSSVFLSFYTLRDSTGLVGDTPPDHPFLPRPFHLLTQEVYLTSQTPILCKDGPKVGSRIPPFKDYLQGTVVLSLPLYLCRHSVLMTDSPVSLPGSELGSEGLEDSLWVFCSWDRSLNFRQRFLTYRVSSVVVFWW